MRQQRERIAAQLCRGCLLATGVIVLQCLASLSLSGLFARQCRAAEIPQYAPIQLRDVMWQVLPRDISCVHIGPDQRIWYGTSRMYSKALQSSLKQIIEAQFREAAPEIPPVPIALFEPEGRVWFLTDENRTLLGYDGSTWVTRSLSRPNRFVGRCPGHPRHEGDGYNCFFDGRGFFIETGGVCSFDGKEWSFQSLLEPEARCDITLQTVPGERELIATVTRTRDLEFWRWREGQWSKVDLPVGEKRFLAPWSGGRWWIYDSRGLRLEPLVSEPQAVGFDQLLHKLKETQEVKAREGFADELLQCPDTTYKKIEQALSTTYDPEVIKLLLSIREKLSSVTGGLSLGKYALKEPWLAHNDLQGTVFIVSTDITESGRLAGPGLVVAGITGEVRFIGGDGFARQGWRGSGDLPLYDKRREVVWLPSSSEYPIRALDLKTGRIVQALPSRSYRLMRAVAGDGALFVSVDDNWQKSPIAVFKPGAPDDRCLIEPKTLLLTSNSSDRFRVSADGSIWADSAENGLVVFDGKKWNTVFYTSGRDSLSSLAVGDGREALVRIGNLFVYVTPKGTDEDANFQKLISRNRERIRECFAAGSLDWNRPEPLVVDSAGNIWYRTDQDFWVLSGEEWLDVRSALRTSDFLRPGETLPGAVVPLSGDDSVLILPSYAPSGMFTSILARVVDGRLVFERGPQIQQDHGFQDRSFPFVRDRQGVLWLPLRGSSVACRVTRLARRGESQELDVGGWPVFCDAGGQLWLFSSHWTTENCYCAHPGKGKANELRLPRGDLKFSLVDGRPGSIYACSSEAIYHLSVRDDTTPPHLKLVGTYAVPSIEGGLHRFESSRLGYIVADSYNQSLQQSRLYLLPFPEAAPSSKPGANR